MPVITDVERKAPAFRGILIAVYALLALGAVTMVYPFLLMLSHSVASSADENEFSIIPRYWYSDAALFKKYTADKYHPRFIHAYNWHYGTVYEEYGEIPVPGKVPDKFLTTWMDFKKRLPLSLLRPGFISPPFRSHPGEVNQLWQENLKDRTGSIRGVNKALGTSYQHFYEISVPPDNRQVRNWYPPRSAAYRDFAEFKKELPPRYLFPVSGRAIWINMLRNRYMQEISRLNRAHGTSYTSFDDIRLPVTLPAGGTAAADWTYLVRHIWPFRYLQVDSGLVPQYRQLLWEMYGSIGRYNQAHGTEHGDFSDITFPASFEMDGPHTADWTEFIEQIPPAAVSLLTVEQMFRDHLEKEYGSAAELNGKCGTSFSSLAGIVPPFAAGDYAELMERRSAARISYMVQNYSYVLSRVFFNGRAVKVTIIFLALVIIGQLLINTACAYALARFNPPFTYQVLLVLLVTMAFPAEVTMIPNFLNIRMFSLLNTYGALVLPMLANGFFIFILKEHFDTMPRELFEAAGMDGANELVIMFRIIMPLSQPVLAWMVLNVFTLAYGSFLFAMVICQNSEMWTLMVWLYQMQNWAPTYMISAGMTLAAIPSLIVFLFCQRIIMRGMVLPMAH